MTKTTAQKTQQPQIYELVRNRRKCLGMSKSDFADSLGISTHTYADFEEGRMSPVMDFGLYNSIAQKVLGDCSQRLSDEALRGNCTSIQSVSR